VNNLHLQLALSYKVPRITAFINEDIKLIKKINLILSKIEKSYKDIHILEIFNILRTLNNVFDMNKLYLIICNEIDFKYHSTLSYLITELDSFESENIIRKFKELSNVE